jgi:hypothetical protein
MLAAMPPPVTALFPLPRRSGFVGNGEAASPVDVIVVVPAAVALAFALGRLAACCLPRGNAEGSWLPACEGDDLSATLSALLLLLLLLRSAVLEGIVAVGEGRQS